MAFDFADWMGLLPGSKKLSEFSIPGAHDSASTIQASIPVYSGKVINKFLRLRLFTQTRGLQAQLEGGIRFLDMRCALVPEGTGFYLELHHEKYSLNLRFDRVLAICKEFLEKHPAETIIMSVKKELDADDSTAFAKTFSAYVAGDRDLWFLRNEIPFLSTVRGKIVLFRRFTEATQGIDASGDRFPSNGTSEEITKAPKLYIQDDYGILGTDISDKVDTVTKTLNKAASSSDRDVLYVSFTSAAGILETDFPINAATYVNPRVRQYFENHKQGHFGVVPRDFEAIDLSSPKPQTLDPTNQLIIQTNVEYYFLQQNGDFVVDFGDGLDGTVLLAQQKSSDAANQVLAFAPSDDPPYLYIESTRTNKVIQLQNEAGLPLVAFRKVRGRDTQLWKFERSSETGSFFITSKLKGAGSITSLGPAPDKSGFRLSVASRGRPGMQLWAVVKSS